jgi:hypothetical protein
MDVWTAWKKLLFCLALVATTCASVTAAKKDDTDGAFAKLKSHYKGLSPKGKFVTGATVGFVGSRLALNTVTKVIKVGAGAFVA